MPNTTTTEQYTATESKIVQTAFSLWVTGGKFAIRK